MITKHGEMDESLLERKDIHTVVNGNKIHRVEYWANGEEVRNDLFITPAQLSLAGDQSNLIADGYPPILMNNDLITLSINDAIQVLTAIYQSAPNSCIDIATNIFNFNADTNQKVDFSGKFYVDGKLLRISMLTSNNLTII